MEEREGRERCELLGEYILEHNATVRTAARVFGVSKSTVHKDVTTHLSVQNPTLSEKVRAVLDQNKSERHLRGGEATRQKYLSARKKI